MITKIRLMNFKSFQDSTIDFSDGLNILVGDNEAGKSTLLEAISLATTGRIHGQYLLTNLSSHLINAQARDDYVTRIQRNENVSPPEMYIEAYLKPGPQVNILRGTNNSLGEDCAGLRIEASLDPAYASEYQQFISDRTKVGSIPIEYYQVSWRGFNDMFPTWAQVKLSISLIDASRIRLASGTDYYLQKIITAGLTDEQRVQVARVFRNQMEGFSKHEDMKPINELLNSRKDDVSSKPFSLGIDTSEARSWESALTPFLDDLPVHQAGSGEQNMLKILLALSRNAEDAHVLLIEEPENHLSFTSLNHLISKISQKCADKQVIISTHSSYVLNKLGLDHLMLLSNHHVSRLDDLSSDTRDYFKKLSGYDTLRMVIAKKVILVEGPSDELIIQRAYRDVHGRRPIEDGVDVLNVRGLAFKRFLDIAVLLQRHTIVVTDNDKKPKDILKKYQPYTKHQHISICFSDNPDSWTLETQLIDANTPALIGEILGRPTNSTRDDLINYMTSSQNKADCALKIHDSPEGISMPEYILRAVHE